MCQYLRCNLFVLDLHFAFICLMFDIGESIISSIIYGVLYLRKGKGKIQPRTGHKDLEGSSDIAVLFL
jgi:hypothetical protein